MKPIKWEIGFSSCPNDTFIFHAMLHSLIDTENFRFIPFIDDVEALNRKAFSSELPITKLSFYAYLLLKDRYTLLDSGAALGYRCGPLLVTRKSIENLAQARIAIPGIYTTAYLLLRLWQPQIQQVIPTRFDRILPGVQSGEFDAGLIIHEGRFIYTEYDCIKMIDLGEWWDSETKLPIPLGCIAIRKDSETISYKEKIESILRHSIYYAFEHRDASRPFIQSYAQEMDHAVIDEHIQLYVNDFSLSLGEKGRRAIKSLEDMAKCRTIL